MASLMGIDHVAITVTDLDASCAFYDRLFGAEIMRDVERVIRVIRLGGGARLSIHQAGNGVTLVADRPTPGSADICFRFCGPINDAVSLLESHGLEIVDGPSVRQTADGKPSHSVYFRDPDRNLIELMAAD